MLALVLRATVVLTAWKDCLADDGQPGDSNVQQTKIMRAERRSAEINLHESGSLLGSSTAEESQLLWRMAREVDDKLQELSRASLSVPTIELLHALRLCAPCKEYKRFGQDYDGGYVLCMDGLENGTELLKGAYSYGICGEDSWGMAVAERFKVPLYEYDCTDSWKVFKKQKIPTPCDTCNATYYNECLAPAGQGSRPEYTTLQRHLTRNLQEHAANGTLLMKIDIEGAEWPFFAQEPLENLRKFNQVVVEFHDLDSQPHHPQYLRAIRAIEDAGLRVMHLHGNNRAGMGILQSAFGLVVGSIPKVLEVSFMRSSNKCAALSYKYLEHGVDQVDYSKGSELPPRAYDDFK